MSVKLTAYRFSRVVKPECPGRHQLQIRTDKGHTLLLVKGGKRAYLWIGGNPARRRCEECFTVVSGPKTLRALAEAILDEVGQ